MLTNIRVPSQPVAIACIDVLNNVWKIELFERIGDAILVFLYRSGASWVNQRGDRIREGIGLYCQSNGSIWVREKDLSERWKVRVSVLILLS